MKYIAAVIAVSAAFLVWECWRLGWRDSSLKRLLLAESSCAAEDRVWFLLYITKIYHTISIAMSFGIPYSVMRAADKYLDYNPLARCHWAVQFAVVMILDSFLGYWSHRVMHCRKFWVLHKIHHSGTEFNVITSFKNHPLEIVSSGLFRLPLALLGGGKLVLAVYGLLNILYQLSVHSELNWGDGFVGRWLLVNPSRHKVHHSSRRDDYNTNFGTLILWDRVFGTYKESYPVASMGFPAMSGKPFQNMVTTWRLFLLGWIKTPAHNRSQRPAVIRSDWQFRGLGHSGQLAHAGIYDYTYDIA